MMLNTSLESKIALETQSVESPMRSILVQHMQAIQRDPVEQFVGKEDGFSGHSQIQPLQINGESLYTENANDNKNSGLNMSKE